ncbi:MAG: DEAD/DEAH box helicase family protein [Candidatus Competibacter sp.]|nr:DEAD/DEAH box helicase family protein [Candidatus Competibacter sp.]
MTDPKQPEIPVQPVDKPIICSPYEEPGDHWVYDTRTGAGSRAGMRRPASYWYRTERTGSAQAEMFAEEERDDLPLVNRLRADVKRWRESGYRGASNVTRELLAHWTRPDRPRRLFFCQREAVETLIYLAELRLPGKSSRTGFRAFEVTDDQIRQLLGGENPRFDGMTPSADFFPTLADRPADPTLLPLRRLACKMATGSGKTVVMAMLVAWAFCNRGLNPRSRDYPHAVLVCCPNLTVKERLQVLRPEAPGNYYAAFDLVPVKYRPLLQSGKVLVTNWHGFQPESEHKEGDRTYAVVDKGPETPETFARRVLGDLADRMPILVLNDESHHCWRPAPDPDAAQLAEEELQEATVWVEGLDRLNNALADGQPGIRYCIDLSATPFYIKGSGHPEGRPFPWIVSDFGLVDAIESGIVKIPRLPVQDTTGRPDPKYFKLWEAIRNGLQPAELLPGRARKPKPEVVYREAQGALLQIAGQWVERFRHIEAAMPGQERVPPVLIVVCDNTEIAEVFYRKLGGETEIEAVTEEEVEDVLSEDGEEDAAPNRGRKKKPKTRTVYGQGEIYPEYFSNTAARKRTIRIDSKLLAEAESADPNKKKRDAAEELRQVVATVGKPGQPGEHVRCVVSVAMLTEGWDANNVTQILGVRAFLSQLLCEQVVGRGLRRMDYTPDPATGFLTEEYVDVYGIPFSVIPFKGRPIKTPQPEDKPKNHVRALPERAGLEMRFPVVEGYAFALRKNLIRCDIAQMERLIIEPNREPTATFVRAAVGYQIGSVSQGGGPFAFAEQNREDYYASTHLQTIQFQVARLIVDDLSGYQPDGADKRRRVLRLQSRHQLFPQVYRYVEEYVRRKVDFQGQHPCELGLEKYVQRLVERLRDAIVPDDTEGEPPLLPLLNRYKEIGTTAEVDFKTTRPCFATQTSHVNQVVADTKTWETSVAFRLEQCVRDGTVCCYARNDGLGLTIPYEYMGVDHAYEPDFLVRLYAPGTGDVTLLLEVKGYEDDQTQAKHMAAQRWIMAANNWNQLGRWQFHVCRNPQLLDKEIAVLVNRGPRAA